MRYKKNLDVRGINVYSYDTHVATIDHLTKTVCKIPWNVYGRSSSPTTSKHVNHVARELGYTISEKSDIVVML